MGYSFSTDNQLCIISWSEKIEKYTGKSSSHVLGKKYFEVLPRIFVGEKDAISISLKKKKELILKSYAFFCLNGRTMADIRINPLKSANGRVKKIEVTVSPDSTCSMAKKLHDSQKLIDIGKMASSLAHGVRNPLNAIKGAVVYLRERYAHEMALIEFTKIMEDEIARLDNFISRFLSTSISNAGLSLTDINSLLKNIEVFTSLQTRANNIRSVFEYGEIPLIMINSFQLEHAILNVINNAIESMHSGGELKVKTGLENYHDADSVIIEISDTGPGIAKSKVNSLSIPLEEKGKGFGLFITREVVKSCGGHIEIKSRKGKGTILKLYLPVNRLKVG